MSDSIAAVARAWAEAFVAGDVDRLWGGATVAGRVQLAQMILQLAGVADVRAAVDLADQGAAHGMWGAFAEALADSCEGASRWFTSTDPVDVLKVGDGRWVCLFAFVDGTRYPIAFQQTGAGVRFAALGAEPVEEPVLAVRRHLVDSRTT